MRKECLLFMGVSIKTSKNMIQENIEQGLHFQSLRTEHKINFNDNLFNTFFWNPSNDKIH